MANKVYTVGEINSYIKDLFTRDFVLNRISIQGEVSNCKYHTSGHIYFSLKDRTGMISCVMFAGSRRGLSFRMDNGQTVIVSGSVDVYERDGKYQLYAREIRQAGLGELYLKFEKLKKELAEMGMFADEYKQPIPRFAQRIGIVTASTGAAVRDMIQTTKRRNPYVQLFLYPALVQGEGAAASICKGIEVLDQTGVDTIIIGRGGGSIEDLWAFNEESVARAIFHCETPVISAVGHETDFTISDFTADLRAATPTAAAELAVYEYLQINGTLMEYQRLMRQFLMSKKTEMREKYRRYALQLRLVSPVNQLKEHRQRAANLQERLQALTGQKLEQSRHQLALSIEKLDGLSPVKKLNQGYSFVTGPDGKGITGIEQVKPEDQLIIHLLNGEINAKVQNTVARKETF